MRTTLIVLMSILFTSNCIAQDEKSTIDGKSFTLKVVEKGRIGKDDKMSDVITFKDGKVSTKFSKDNGFPDATYTTESKDGFVSTIISFKGKCKGKKDNLSWEGVINGDEIEGTAIVKRKGAIRTIYEFKGVLK